MAQPEHPVSGRSAGSAGDEKPLDPAVEAVRRKMARLLLGSFGVMVLGLIAVFAAIVYKLNTGVAVSSDLVEADIALPAGSQILSVSLDGPHMLIHASQPDNPRGRILVVETESGRIIRRFTLSESAR
jgi:hypothetical protein